MHCNVDDKTQSVRFFSFALPTGRSEVTIAFRRSAAGSCSPADMRNLKRLFLHGGVPLRVRNVPLFGVKTPRVPPLCRKPVTVRAVALILVLRGPQVGCDFFLSSEWKSLWSSVIPGPVKWNPSRSQPEGMDVALRRRAASSGRLMSSERVQPDFWSNFMLTIVIILTFTSYRGGKRFVEMRRWFFSTFITSPRSLLDLSVSVSLQRTCVPLGGMDSSGVSSHASYDITQDLFSLIFTGSKFISWDDMRPACCKLRKHSDSCFRFH